MNQKQSDRLVDAWEAIAKALEGLRNEAKRAGERYWPEPGQQREVIISHVLTEEDRIRERQGNNIPIEDWLTNLSDHEDDEPIGERTAQWLRDHPQEEAKKPHAGPEGPGPGTEDKGGTRVRKTKGKA